MISLKSLKILFILSAILTFTSLSAQGFGTSAINLNTSTISIARGGSAFISYNITITSGGSWGSSIEINNQNQLSSSGIISTLSQSIGDPPFSGILTITTSQSTPSGVYQLTMSATGDDPTTQNATLMINVTNASTTSTAQQTSQTPPAQQSSGNTPLYALAVIAVIITAIVASFRNVPYKSIYRLIIIGVALILIGIVAWLYGDYNNGLSSYIWSGVALILVGTMVWLFGDWKGGLFDSGKNYKLIIIGVALILVGTMVWLYGDYKSISTYIWPGVIIILIGIVVWLRGDKKGRLI